MFKPVDEYTAEERGLIEDLLLQLNLNDYYGRPVISWEDAIRVYRQNKTENARRDRIIDIARRYGGMTDYGWHSALKVFALTSDAADHVGLCSWLEARDGINRRQPTDDEFERFCEAFTIRCIAAKISQQ